MKWTKAAENMVRHPGGTYYLQAKIAGKKVRKSLKTEDLRAAKRRRDSMLEDLRHAASIGDRNIETLGEALALEREMTMAKPKLKQATKDYYAHIFLKLAESLPTHMKPADWTPDGAQRWWNAHCVRNPSPLHANNALAIVRRMVLTLVERGIRRDDPTKNIKRLKQPKTRVDDMPSVEIMNSIVASIRGMNRPHSEECANMVEFLAWSGVRIAELREIRWEHIGEQWITITGGATGTKNHEIRQIPINARTRAVLDAIRERDSSGPVFHLVSPRLALNNATERLGIRHMRVHDLRHWFTSHCIEKGIDVVTLAAWLGHKDGGRTLLATYAHHQKAHSLASAEKLGA